MTQNQNTLSDIFSIYFKIGFSHIYNIAAIDHILFLVALCALFSLKDWRQLLILITAFTIGHSITLALAILDIIPINERLIELLIPVTIMITALFNAYTIWKDKGYRDGKSRIHYMMALGFGWIHGMGFSNYLRSTLFPGENLFGQLFSFNIGIELGQILILAKILLLTLLFTKLLKIKRNHWAFTLSGLAFAVSLYLIIDQL